ELVVPFMALAYILLALVIVAMNITELPHVFMLIIKSAFGIEQAGSGALGYAISQAMINGIKRGLFSNEAGMGSAPNAAATATPYPPHPASQG
ncbi:alanine:cation symporter family protein, partial [Escherichia coli]|nr:alanine:cation symporter family protein [Escherichia coli]